MWENDSTKEEYEAAKKNPRVINNTMKKKPSPDKPIPTNEVLGVRLHPPTLQRQAAAVAMGFKRGIAFPYSAKYLFHDSIVFLWLCSIPESAPEEKWSVDRAEEYPDDAKKEARKWAEKLGIGINTAAWHQAWPVFWAIIQKIESAKAEPVIPKDARREEIQGEGSTL